ncbi:hypothetical protein J3459_011149 [Metarhizium acridum]|uniref:uncharacterized protein n=1 Tax=Metarhizium acridum TaxID=92637 RepID=UPI001C6BFF6B|nr:hypothetical protein J3458_009172 [Metarhizium acridum]KAG8420258.1 hypothetical protein J3459_011225 [Metarhizium acridum]KAG8420374.1 hypothetical protein J3459_011149 [Metarhizium acridum]
MATTQEISDRRSEGSDVTLFDKVSWRVNGSCIKRTLCHYERQLTTQGDLYIPPTTFPQRLRTDEAVLQYLFAKTEIPLPRSLCAFESIGAFFHLTEHVSGIAMSDLSEPSKQFVKQQLLQHVKALQNLHSDTPGVPGQQLLCPPLRVNAGKWKVNSCWKPRADLPKEDYVFCHNDLRQDNIIVNPISLRIVAILNWESGGFWPKWFEMAFWERAGPDAVLEGEVDNTQRCREWLLKNCEEVVMPPLLRQGQ